MNIRAIILVGIGGFIGSVGRYIVGSLILTAGSKDFPLPTFVVNVLGCFLIGIIAESAKFNKLSDNAVLFLATGFCGGFTTFSSYMLDILSTQESNISISVLYGILSIIIGYFFLFIGIKLTYLTLHYFEVQQ